MVSMPPRVSICIPAYCQVKYLKRTLESILQQDYDDYEIVITDDSPNESIITLIESMDFGGRMRFHRNDATLGSPENWNEAVRRASGDYIKIMHHDDYFVCTHALRLFVRSLDEQSDVALCFSASRADDVVTGETRDHLVNPGQLAELLSDPVARLFKGNIIGAPSATIYRRSVGQEYDGKLRWLVDVEFYMRIFAQNLRVAYIPEVLVGTSTNAGHQVTAVCQDSGQVELFEYARVFGKIAGKMQRHPDFELRWVQLFDQYGIEHPQDFARYGVEHPAPAGYFKSLLKWRRYEKALLQLAPKPGIELPTLRKGEPWFVRRLRRMLFIAGYLAYGLLPPPVRQFWRWAKVAWPLGW